MIKEYETAVSKIIYYDKNKKKTNFWRISVKFQLWVPLKKTNGAREKIIMLKFVLHTSNLTKK